MSCWNWPPPRLAPASTGRRLDCAQLDAACGETFVDQVGRPGPPARLMAGLHVLKHVKGLSDQAVCAAGVENPYVQAFCGERFFQHRLPLDRGSMSRWRKRVVAERLETPLAEILRAAAAVIQRRPRGQVLAA